MVLHCTGAGGTDGAVVDAICDALTVELANLAPHRIVRRASGGISSAFGVWEGVLEVVRTERSVWEARLNWGLVGSEGSSSRLLPQSPVRRSSYLEPRRSSKPLMVSPSACPPDTSPALRSTVTAASEVQ